MKNQDWTVSENGDSAKFLEISESVAIFMRDNRELVSEDLLHLAGKVVAKLAHKHQLMRKGHSESDWTYNPQTGCANDSYHYLYCVEGVSEILARNVEAIKAGKLAVTLQVAKEIVRTLAREYELVLPSPTS